MGRGCEYIFFQNRHKNGQQTEKMLNITNCQGIKTTVRCHFIPFRMAIIKKTSNRCWWGCSEKGTFMHCGIMDWCIQYGKLYDGSSQNENCHMIQHFHIWGFTWKKLKTLMWKDTCTPVLIGALLTVARIWKQLVSNKEDMCVHTRTYNGILYIFNHRIF